MSTNTYIDIHLLQTVPPSCVNRDDTGSPKTAMYGGVRRARVSSQSWKRATRKQFEKELEENDLGIRTKQVVELVAKELNGLSELDEAEKAELAAAVITAAGLKLAKARKGDRVETQYLVLISHQQARALAEQAREAFSDAENLDGAVKFLGTADAKKAAKAVLRQGNSIDLALFGRMVADDTDLNVDASCQVAHALSVHAADTEFDYFTAVDDMKDEKSGGDDPGDAGAGMIGTVEFTSATLYRYASINVGALDTSLGDRAMTERAIRAFLTSFTRSMPTGKVNTFANFTLPEAVVVSIRDDQPISFVGAFENPIAPSSGYVTRATAALVKWASDVTDMYGSEPVRTWVAGMGEVGEHLAALGETGTVATIPDLVAAAAVARLSE